ncbi:MAG: TrmB family transcriptional regulator [Nitrososphaerales archaeon]
MSKKSVEPDNLLRDAYKLNLYEAKAYKAILKGPLTPKQASSISGVPMPRIYDILKSLIEKGFAERIGDSYQGSPPEIALDYRSEQLRNQFASEEQKRVEAKDDISETLSSVVGASEATNEVVILRGIMTIVKKFSDILLDSKDTILMIRKGIEAKTLFQTYIREIKSANKTLKILVPEQARLTRAERESFKESGVAVRRCNSIIFDLMIADQDLVIGVPDPASSEVFHSIALWIRNPNFARALRDVVDDIWKDSKEI